MLDPVLLGALLTVLILRVTVTEAPPVPLGATALTLSDPLTSVLLSTVLLAICGIWWLRRLLGSGRAYRPTGLEPGLGLLLVACLLATAGASNRRLAVQHTLVFLSPALAALTLAQLLDRTAHRRLVLIVLVALGVLVAAHGAGQWLGDNAEMVRQYEAEPTRMLEPLGIEPNTLPHFLFEHRLYTRGVRSYFTTRNSAACFGLVSLFAALALGSSGPATEYGGSPNAHRPGRWLVLALLVGGLLLYRSKGALLGLLAGMGAVGLWHKWGPRIRRHRALLLGAGLVVLGLAGGGLAFWGRSRGTLPGGQSMAVRWQYWSATGRLIADHPWFGVGGGNFAAWYHHEKAPAALEAVADPHNFILSLWVQLGPLGLLGLLACLVVPCFRATTVSGTGVAPFTHHGRLLAAASFGTALLLLRPILAPLPPTGQPAVALYLFVTQRLLPLAIGLGSTLWLLGVSATRSHPAGRIGPWIAGGTLAVLGANLTDFALFEPPVLTAFWVLVACARFPASGVAPRAFRPLRPATRILGLSALAIAAVLILLLAVRPVVRSTRALNLAQGALIRGDFTEAEGHLAEAVAADPWSALAPSVAGHAYLDRYLQGNSGEHRLWEQALRFFEIARERHPADYRPYQALGRVYEADLDWNRADAAYRAASRRYPGTARLWLALGRVAEKRNAPDQAVTYYQKALAIEEGFEAEFTRLYPQRKTPVNRLGVANCRFVEGRLRALMGRPPESATPVVP